MNRIQAGQCLAIALVLIAGCNSSPPPPTRPTRPDTASTLDANVPADVAASATSDAATPDEGADKEEASTADAISIKELDWTQLQELVAAQKGKIVVVDIWSTSCEPCLREFPGLVSLQKRHPEDVVCISFDCDYDGRKNKPVAYYRERVLNNLTRMQAGKIVNVMCTTAADELFQQIELDSIPAVCVYDRSGKLARRFDNRTPASETEEGISYEKQIDPLVAELVKAEQN